MEWTPLPAAPEGAIMAERKVPWEKGASTMESAGMIGVDLGKRSFQLRGTREDGSAAFRMKASRDRFLEEMSKRGPCKVAMEACGGAHHWGRELRSMGFEVRLVPPTYVKPFVKRRKNDAADAEAVCEAASRPGMRFVAAESAERQAEEAPREAHVPLAFDPGEAFQFDWSAETAALGGTPVKAGRRTSAFATAGWRSFNPAAGRAWDARGRAQPGVRVLRRLLPARDP